jgi:predicted RNase H-like HicB family nuclease
MLIQWSDEDQCYLVTLPEWPNINFGGPSTHGDTYEEAAKHGREVLETLLEGDGEKPEPDVYTDEDEDEEPYFSPEEREAYWKERDEYYATRGLLDLPRGARAFCEVMAEGKIEREGVTDEKGRQAIYAEVKQTTLECIENAKHIKLDGERGTALRAEIERRYLETSENVCKEQNTLEDDEEVTIESILVDILAFVKRAEKCTTYPTTPEIKKFLRMCADGMRESITQLEIAIEKRPMGRKLRH